MSEASNVLRPLIAGLRRSGDEVQTARVITQLARADQVFARGFVNLVLATATAKRATKQERPNAPNTFRLDSLCAAEAGTYDELEGRGRLDLLFTTEGPPAQRVGIELKHAAPYGPGQPGKYLSHLRPEAGERTGLVVITGHRHPEIDPTTRDDQQWLGEVLWADLQGELEKLGFEPNNRALSAAWRALLQQMREDGDLGIAAMTIEPFRDWAAERSSSRRQPHRLLDAVAERAHAELAKTAQDLGYPSCVMRGRAEGRVVRELRMRQLALEFEVRRPRQREPHLVTLALSPRFRSQPGSNAMLSCEVHVRSDLRKLVALKEGTRRGKYELSRGTRWWAGWPLKTQGIDTGAELCDRVLRQWRTALKGIERLEPFVKTAG